MQLAQLGKLDLPTLENGNWEIELAKIWKLGQAGQWEIWKMEKIEFRKFQISKWSEAVLG